MIRFRHIPSSWESCKALTPASAFRELADHRRDVITDSAPHLPLIDDRQRPFLLQSVESVAVQICRGFWRVSQLRVTGQYLVLWEQKWSLMQWSSGNTLLQMMLIVSHWSCLIGFEHVPFRGVNDYFNPNQGRAVYIEPVFIYCVFKVNTWQWWVWLKYEQKFQDVVHLSV